MGQELSRRDVHRVAEGLAEQGCKVRRTTSGYFFVNPSTLKSASMHFTNSDPRSFINSVKQIERMGYEFPLPTKFTKHKKRGKHGRSAAPPAAS